MRHAQGREEGDERTLVLVVGSPGQHQRHQNHRAHIEEGNTANHGVNCLRQNLAGILGFTCGHTNHLSATESENNTHRQGDDRKRAHGQEAAKAGPVVETTGDLKVPVSHVRVQLNTRGAVS